MLKSDELEEGLLCEQHCVLSQVLTQAYHQYVDLAVPKSTDLTNIYSPSIKNISQMLRVTDSGDRTLLQWSPDCPDSPSQNSQTRRPGLIVPPASFAKMRSAQAEPEHFHQYPQ